jgi:CBS domain-containing protein
MPSVAIDNLMTRDAVTVRPETSVIDAANMLSVHHLSGLPVVDANGILVGVVTEDDFLTKGSAIHLPTFLKLLEGFSMYQNEALMIDDKVKAILRMRIKDIMNREPMTLPEGASMDEALRIFTEYPHMNPIPVVDASKKLKGVLSKYDIIKMFAGPRTISASSSAEASDRSLDHDVDAFLSDFEKKFLFVAKNTTRYWLFYSILFAIVGFVIAFALIVQFVPR